MDAATACGVNRARLQVIAIAIVAAALVMVAVYTYQPFVSPLTIISPVEVYLPVGVYLPLVVRQRRPPDTRIGVAEHTPQEALLLGLAAADYVSGQWRLPLPGDTAVFLRPTERPHWSTWLLCSWSTRDGWYDEDGCREWVKDHPGMIYIVGNELSIGLDPLGGTVGDGYWVNVAQYTQWYHAAWELIKSEDPTATIAPYGPVGSVTAGLLLAVWDSYQKQFGTPMPVDFYSVHHYCQPNDGPDWCWTKLTHWIDWLEQHRGTHWDGPRDYRVTEWGLSAWARSIPIEASLALMAGMIPHLLDNDIGITQSAWWPSCLEWPHCTLLVRGGQVTELGAAYLRLALTGN